MNVFLLLLSLLAGSASAAGIAAETAGKENSLPAAAEAIRRSVQDLDPISAGQLPELEPGLMRLRNLDPEDEDLRAALAPMARALERRGYDAPRLAAIRLGASIDPAVIRDLSEAYRVGAGSARAYSNGAAALIDRSRPRTVAVEFLAQTKSRLDAMALLYGSETVEAGSRSVKRRLLVIAQGDLGPEDAVAAAELAAEDDDPQPIPKRLPPSPRPSGVEAAVFKLAAIVAALAALSLFF